ncbi:hypothetical protein Bca4012_087050 [Brassica carinata]
MQRECDQRPNEVSFFIDKSELCLYHGSSNYMEKEVQFTGILSDKAQENPDFFNWNRVKLCYCDGASFSGDGQNEAAQLQFRGERI